MVEPANSLDAVFRALADPTRRQILRRIAGRERSVSELAAPFRMTLAAVSKHVQSLEAAGLLVRRRVGREALCRLRPEGLRAAESWLAYHRRFWTARLDALERTLQQTFEGRKP